MVNKEKDKYPVASTDSRQERALFAIANELARIANALYDADGFPIAGNVDRVVNALHDVTAAVE